MNNNYYNEIKNELLNNEVYKRVKDYSKNRNELSTYYNVGKLLIEAQGGEDRAKYGDSLIKEYSKRLTKELGKGYSTRNLKNMRKFYLLHEKGQTLSAKLNWSHYVELLSFNDINEINYYINTTERCNLSVRELREKIKNKEYQRLENNTKLKLSKLLIKSQGGEDRAKYGNILIKEYSLKLQNEVGKKYGYKNLYNVRKVYLTFKDNDI